MRQRYKLRLSDGTVLAVDEAGLNTWLVDDKAMVQAANGRWSPLKEVLARQRAAAKYASQESSGSAAPPLVPPKPREKHSGGRDALPLVYPKDHKAKAPRGTAAPSGADPVEPPSLDDPLGLQAPASELTGLAREDTPESRADEGPPTFDSKPLCEDEAAPVFESKPLYEDEAPPAFESKPLYEDEAPPAFESKPLYEDEAPPLPETASPSEPISASPVDIRDWVQEAGWQEPIPPTPIAARPSLQSLADDPAPRIEYAPEPSTPSDRLPAISLKPFDDRDEGPTAAPTRPGVYPGEPDDFVEEAPQRHALDPRLVRAADALGVFLSEWSERLQRGYLWLQSAFLDARAKWRARRAARPSPRAPEEPHPAVGEPAGVQVLADEPTAYREDTPPTAIADEGPPVIRLKPLDEGGAPLRAARSFFSSVRSRASGWAATLRERVDRPSPSDPSNEPWRVTPPREPLKAPPSLGELPVLRLVEINERKEAEDIYEGESESLLPGAWLWTKRLVLFTGLVVGSAFAALNWDTWFPKAAELGMAAPAEVGEFLRARDQEERERRAQQEATEQLPHLLPETIRLILSGSPTRVLDPPAVFLRACEATDSGQSALTAEEEQELQALESVLLDALSPAERERVLEYDAVRDRRATFAFEDRSALDLVARGTRALSWREHERLQALYGKAIAAGLAFPTEAAPGAAAGH